MSNRLLKKAHVLRWRASALAAAYIEYAWTQLRRAPRLRRAALHLDLFEQPGRKRVFQHPARFLVQSSWLMADCWRLYSYPLSPVRATDSIIRRRRMMNAISIGTVFRTDAALSKW